MNRLSKLFTAIAATLMISLALAFSGQAAAKVILYGVASGFGTGEQGSGGSGGGTGPGCCSQFHIIDLDTGVAAEISMDIGFAGGISGLAIDKDGVVFSARGGRGPNTIGRGVSPSLLFTIEPFNGLGSVEIGPMGIEFGLPDSAGGGPGAGDFDQFGSLRQNVSDMAFNPIDGVLYGMAARGSQLFTVDTGTGLATRIGAACDSPQIGAPGGFCRRGNAITFDAHGTLFWANDFEIAELDPSTGLIVGAAIPLDLTPFGTPDEPNADFRVVGMDFHPLTGELYASVLQRQLQDSPPARATLAILDPLTGTFDIIGQIDGTGVKLEGIAFTPLRTDHYNAYDVRSEAVIGGGGKKMNELNIDVTLDDQFGPSVLTVKKAKLLLVPVDKNGEGIVDEVTHLVCYDLRDPAGGKGTGVEPRVDVAVVNQFNDLVGDQEMEVRKLKMLCVPSTKDVLP